MIRPWYKYFTFPTCGGIRVIAILINFSWFTLRIGASAIERAMTRKQWSATLSGFFIFSLIHPLLRNFFEIPSCFARLRISTLNYIIVGLDLRIFSRSFITLFKTGCFKKKFALTKNSVISIPWSFSYS